MPPYQGYKALSACILKRLARRRKVFGRLARRPESGTGLGPSAVLYMLLMPWTRFLPNALIQVVTTGPSGMDRACKTSNLMTAFGSFARASNSMQGEFENNLIGFLRIAIFTADSLFFEILFWVVATLSY